MLQGNIMQISLIVIRCENLEKSKVFYESLGLTFKKEKHGNGVEHYSSEQNNIVFELYPNKGLAPNDNIRLGFKVKSINILIKRLEIIGSYEFNNNTIYIVKDPDNRKVELS